MERDNIPDCFSHTDYNTDYIVFVIFKIMYYEENSTQILVLSFILHTVTKTPEGVVVGF